MSSIYLTEVTKIGPEVEEMLEAGILILFEDGAPPELAEMSVLHKCSEKREEPPEPGDVLAVGSKEFLITAVGDKAWKNILELGHASFKFDGAEEPELPGQICVEQEGSEEILESIQPGVQIEIRAAN